MSATTSQKKRSRDEDREVQDLAFLKRIKRAAESDEKRAASLKQQEIFISQWPELAIIHLFIHQELRSP